jgi:hypothetical protein
VAPADATGTVPAGGGSLPRSRAALGIMLAGTTTGAWGAATGLGQAGVGNTHDNANVTTCGLCSPVGAGFRDRTLPPRPRKSGLKQSLWDQRPSGKSPQWNAGSGAHPQAEGGASRLVSVARAARRLRADHATLRLPAFHFLSFFFRS